MSPETHRLLNPPFLAAINASAASGFLEEASDGLPLLYAFLIPAMVLHKDTREVLPKVVTTKMPSWSQQHAGVLAFLPGHVTDLERLVRVSLIVGHGIGMLSFTDTNSIAPGVILPSKESERLTKQSLEVPEILGRSHFLGRWLSTTGTPATVFSILGIGL